VETRDPVEIEESARRRAQVVALYQRGLTFEQIGQRLDPPVSKQRAHQLWKDALKQIVAPNVQELREHHRAMLGEALKLAWEIAERDHVAVSHGQVVKGVDGNPLHDDAPKLQAIARVQALSESMRKLDGADAPAKTEVTGQELRVTIVGTNTEAMQ
jgi:hypothetical protein